MNLPVYLDNNATTRVDPRVLQAMLPTFTEHYGNPASSTHSFGWYADELVAIAREQVAAAVGALPGELIFTAGATEANNLAIRGLAAARLRHGGRLHAVTVATEHHSVLQPFKILRDLGIEVTVLGVLQDGSLPLESLASALRPETFLVSLMLANNEIGAVHDVAALAEVAHAYGAAVHCDATQALGKLSLDVSSLKVDLLSLSAHKAYGPKGVGALYRRSASGVELEPLITGSGQESGVRSGTLNVPGIVGFGKACALISSELATEAVRVRALSELMWRALEERVTGIMLNGPTLERRLPGNLNFSIRNRDVQGALPRFAGKIAVSVAAACTSVTGESSHVLDAIEVERRGGRSAIRIGLGRFTTEEEVRYAVEVIREAFSGGGS